MTAENEVRITLTDVFNKQELQNKEVTAILGEIKTSVAVLIKSVEPQTGINAEVFKRLLVIEKKVWALPSAAVIIAIAGVIVAYMRP